MKRVTHVFLLITTYCTTLFSLEHRTHSAPRRCHILNDSIINRICEGKQVSIKENKLMVSSGCPKTNWPTPSVRLQKKYIGNYLQSITTSDPEDIYTCEYELIPAQPKLIVINYRPSMLVRPSKEAIKLPANKYDWSASLAIAINSYFKNPYKHDPRIKVGKSFRILSSNVISRKINGKWYVVYRKRHGLLHGARQGFLAVDIIEGLHTMYMNNPSDFTAPSARALAKWVVKQYKQDPLFKQKVEAAAAFQRTGRESEASSSSNPKLYNSYERTDARNFAKFAQKYTRKNALFGGLEEIQLYKEAILWSTADEGIIDENKNEDLKYLRKIIHASHILDLRRLPDFDAKRIKSTVAEQLFGKEVRAEESWEIKPEASDVLKLIDKLWDRAGEYLEGTGDRDVVTQRTTFGDKFFILSQTPTLLTETLHTIRETSPISFTN